MRTRVELVGEVDGKRTDAPPADGYVQEPTPHGHMGELGSEVDRAAEIKNLRDGLAAELRTEIVGMNLDNFIVRPHRADSDDCGQLFRLKADSDSDRSRTVFR